MLSGGASLAFPLFVLDANKEVESGIGQNNSTITIIGANGSSAPSLDIGATIRNTDGSFVIATLPATTSFTIGQLNPQPSGKYGEYLVLINKNSSDVSFCVQSTKELARQRIRVDGQ
ncbi:MAG: hypothetical protein H6766_02985 [Candidatus Peribacteria bacterium]|nr:MAG: hypothetical protein H6766_02985 [Candidatus Peribacteria bacterium]